MSASCMRDYSCWCHRFQPNSDITGMMSVEGELVPFKTRIKPSEANGAVEKWLVQVRCIRRQLLALSE